MRGAFLITLAQLVTKILGAIHRPVAQLILGGDYGIGMASPPSNAYYIILGISSVGLNVAISRLVSERIALGDLRGARRVFRVAAGTLLVSGVFFSAAFALFSPYLARVTGFPESTPGFFVLAPALFFVAVLCVFRGLYQGMQQMEPSAMSQVVEQIARVTFSTILMLVLTPVALSYGAASFNAGNTIGIFLGVVYLGWLYLKRRPTAAWTTVAPDIESYEHESMGRLLRRILAIAVPLSVIGAILPVMNFVDSSLVKNRLLDLWVGIQQLDPEVLAQLNTRAGEALGWLGNAGTLRDLPTVLTTALYISLVPAITESLALGRIDQARSRIATAFRITFLIGIPATVGLLVGARDAYGVAFTGEGWIVMGPLALSTILVMVQQTAAGPLQGVGRIWLSVRNLVAGLVVKIVLTYWWTGVPGLEARGAAYATVAGFGLAAALNLWGLWRYLGFRVNVRGDVAKPLLASLPMAVVLWLLSPLVRYVVPWNRIAGLIVVAMGGVAYLVAILALGGVTMADIGLIPGFSQRTANRLRRYRLLRD